jgi:hypothetical protein
MPVSAVVVNPRYCALYCWLTVNWLLYKLLAVTVPTYCITPSNAQSPVPDYHWNYFWSYDYGHGYDELTLDTARRCPRPSGPQARVV